MPHPPPAAAPSRPHASAGASLTHASFHPAAPPQVLRPVAVSLLNRLRSLATQQQRSGSRALQTAAAGPLGAGRARTGAGRGSRRRMEDALSPKSPTGRRAEEVMASGGWGWALAGQARAAHSLQRLPGPSRCGACLPC